MTTVHAYTASQGIVDGPSEKNLRMGRAGAATGKAIDLVKMAISRSRFLQPLKEEILPLTKNTLIRLV